MESCWGFLEPLDLRIKDSVQKEKDTDMEGIVSWVEEKKSMVGSVLVGGVLLLVILAIHSYFTVKTIHVNGNTYYTKEQIINMVMDGYLGRNSLYLDYKYRNTEITDIPFIQSMDVEIVSHDTVKIMVYEKSLAGYVDYLGHYMYFDREGIVVESSTYKNGYIPEVAGLTFESIALYQPLMVSSNTIFKQILSTTQILTKYEIPTDKIYFDSQYNMFLYFNKVKVKIGETDNLEFKIMQLKAILPEIIEYSGNLDLENLTEHSKSITFQRE